ncbi:alpha/beta fold hydrolase [Patescibacteria group bacterium]
MQVNEKSVLINGLDSHYKIQGEGIPLLVLHGWGGSSNSWASVQNILAEKGFQVIVPDLPGFGKTNPPNKGWGVSDYVEWTSAFASALGITEPLFLLGHSFGGRVAIKLSAKYPTEVKSLILCASAGIKPKKGLKGKTLSAVSKVGKSLPLGKFQGGVRTGFYKLIGKTDYMKAQGTMKDTIKEVLKEDLLPYLSKIQANTLVVWGKNDKTVPLLYGKIIKEKIPGSELIIIDDSGHSPHLDNPEKLSEIITHFIT